jgi:hypothetical protein
MNLSASFISRSVVAPPVFDYGLKLASRVEPGQLIHLADGSSWRVQKKVATAEGVHLRLARKGRTIGVYGAQLALMDPVSPAAIRLIRFAHSIVAAAVSIDGYVKEIIRKAGLPVDESMNWTSYLRQMYWPSVRRYSTDPERIDYAILQIIVHELYEKRLLDSDSPFAHFDQDHPKLKGKPLAEKVTAYLTDKFKNCKGLVTMQVQQSLGVGAQGDVGLKPVDSTDSKNSDDEKGREVREFAHPARDHDNVEGSMDIVKFLQAFTDHTVSKQTRSSVEVLNTITQGYQDGLDASEVRSKLRDEWGMNPSAVTYIMQRWMKLLNSFATDPSTPWSKTSIARRFVNEFRTFLESKSTPRVSSLILAAVEENGQPVEQGTTPPLVPPPPPPPNPNVQQQNSVKQQNGTTTAPAENDADPNDTQDQQPNQPKKTITPEIPGVNHTASEDVMQKNKFTRNAAAKRAYKEPTRQEIEQFIDQNGGQIPRALHFDPNTGALSMSDPDLSKSTMSANEIRKRLGMSYEASVSGRTASQTLRRASQKFARLRRIATEEPQELGVAIEQLGDSLTTLADNLTGLRENLDLVAEPLPKDATVRQKLASRAKFAKALRRLAEENPEQLADALNEFYLGLEEVVNDTEALADNLNIDLVVPESDSDVLSSDVDAQDTDQTENEAPVL